MVSTARQASTKRSTAPADPHASSAGQDKTEVAGTQSIQRTLRVLRFVSSAGSAGTNLNSVVKRCELSKGTAHRLLSVLLCEGFLRYDRATHLYSLGYEANLLSWSANAHRDVRALAQPSLIRICEVWEDTAFLSMRSGHDSICVDRHVGRYPIKTLTMEVGMRRPLGIGAGSLALLTFMDPDEVERSLGETAKHLDDYPAFSIEKIRNSIEETRQNGFSYNNERVTEGVSAVGVPVFDTGNQVIAALSVAAISQRLVPDRRAKMVEMLKEESRRLSKVLIRGEDLPRGAHAGADTVFPS